MNYETFFNLSDSPFRITPDPAYYFPGAQYDEGLETLEYSIASGEGFIQITGCPGVGKTLLIRSLLGQLDNNIITALIFHPRLSPEELLKVILVDLGMPPDQVEDRSKEFLLRSFREMLLEKGRQEIRTVIIIDEAQNLPDETLEELRLLSNLETDREKLLQIILVGQPELEEKLNQPQFTQLHQRITTRYKLEPLKEEETGHYIAHRLSRAGANYTARFPLKTIQRIHQESRGIPRLVNTICERALMAAYVEHSQIITEPHISKAVQSLSANNSTKTPDKRFSPTLVFLLLFFLIGTGIYFCLGQDWSTGLIADVLGSSKEAISSSKTGDTEPPAVAAPQVLHTTSMSPPPEADSAPPEKTTTVDVTLPQTAAEEKTTKNKEVIDGDLIGQPENSYSAATPPSLDGVHIPPGWPLVLVDQTTNQIQVLHSDGQTQQIVIDPQPMPLRKGLYILGKTEDNRYFLFREDAFFSWERNENLAKQLWEKITPPVPEPLIPVLVDVANTDIPGAADESTALCTAVEDWAVTWRDLDIAAHVDQYDKALLTHKPFTDRPSIVSREQFRQRKEKLFSQTSAISLLTSPPLCLVDPQRPNHGVALFFQRYISAGYADEGSKALFFNKKESDPEKGNWKIVGRLWIPKVVIDGE
jgi:general secretion pathway protein A